MKDNNVRTVRLAIKLTDEEYEHFKKLASDMHLPASTFVRVTIMAMQKKDNTIKTQ